MLKQIACGFLLCAGLLVGTAQEKSLNEQLMTAVQMGDKARVEALIASGANVNAENYNSGTPLHYAATYDKLDIAELLIAKGADVNAKITKANFGNYLGWTPLHDAACFGYRDVAALLITKHADVNAKSKSYDETPLDVAAFNGKMDVAELLIAKGADVNSKEIYGDTPLFHSKDKDITVLLIAKGADVNTKNIYSASPLHAAASSGRADVVEVLIAKGADVNAKDKYGETPLYKAAHEGHKDVVELLLAKGAPINPAGLTPLYAAASGGKKDVAELLIARGADVNARNDVGRTPLYVAASADLAELLIAKGADVNAKDNDGDTPLFAADGYGRKKDLAELLVAKGADVNAKNKVGDSALHDAAEFGNKDVAELLIAKGADLNAKDNNGWTPLMEAMVQGHDEIAALLIAKGADVNAKNKDGWTQLHDAISGGHVNVAKLLIANGADMHAKDTSGRTPLDLVNSISDAKVRQEMQTLLLDASKQSGNDIPGLLAEFKTRSDNEVVRAAIIDLALKQHPAIPPEAEAAAGRGAYIFKNATSTDEKLNAAKEYLKAIELAPWVANYYFNLCTVLEKTPYTQQALHACKLYLVAAPNAADADEMNQRIAGLQYAADRDKTKMKQRTAYIKSRGIDDLYRFGGITGTVSGQEIAMKLFVDWTAAPPKYQVWVGCLQGSDAYGIPHDLVSTDTWVPMCKDNSNMHLVISPEGEGFVSLTSGSDSLRATLDDLFIAKQKTMAQAVMFSAIGDDLKDRYYVTYMQGGHDQKHAGYLMYESDCNGTVLKKDPRALPDDFVSGEETKDGKFGKFYPEVILGEQQTDLCATQFASKTGYHFGEQE